MSTTTYPDRPGFKRAGTSEEAAAAIAPKAQNLRDRVLAALTEAPGTPEQVSERLCVPVMSLRPRFSELFAKGAIEDTGRRDRAQGGRQAIIWRVVA